jgi:RecA/RadA recombinase
MSLMDKLISNSKIKLTSGIKDSKVFGKKDMCPTPVPMVNVALSGKLDGGLVPGLLMLAGPSKHFKSAFALLMAAAYQKKYSDGIVLFYDSEFGTPQSYFESFGVDMDRVVHTPITDVEQLKFDIMGQLEKIEKTDNVCILVDSIGNLASKKEVEDAMNEKSVADMSRAKQMKSLFRMVTPHLNLKDIPMIAVNHTYKEIGLYPKDIVSGGTGAYYSADAIWIIGRQQEKDKQSDKEISGYNFVINIEKSRHVREKSKIPITVTFEGGIAKWSGLLDVALDGGYVVKPKVGWYEVINPETGEVLSDKNMREKEFLNDSAIWMKIFQDTNFKEYVENKYRVASGKVLRDDDEIDIDIDVEDDYDTED